MRNYRLILLSLLLLLGSCVKEREVAPGEGGLVELDLRFGASLGMDVNVTTKSTMGLEPENKVFNLYLFIFDGSGKKIYGQYFDSDNLGSGASTMKDWWEISNNVIDNTTHKPVTSGTIHIKTQDPNGSCTVVVITNIDAEMVNISPEQLGTVLDLSSLEVLPAKLNQRIVSRSGYFPMTGRLDLDNIADIASHTLLLKRLDAKVFFNVQVAPGSPIRSFTPLQWQVVNVPTVANVLGHANEDAANTASDFFNTSPINFETQELYKNGSGQTVNYSGTSDPIVVHGFSFYMMENRKTPTAPEGTWEYKHREMKNPDGSFAYAHPLSTYVILTGNLELDPAADAYDVAQANAHVQYVIHLGDFSSSNADFNIRRNHTYTYNILINGVGSIDAMVNSQTNDEPSATGLITLNRDSVYECDAHYCSQVITFNVNNITGSDLSWYVITPFNPNGSAPNHAVDPISGEEIELTSEIDCKWVEFRLNDMEGGKYKKTERQLYKPTSGAHSDGQTWNISKLVAFLKEEAVKYGTDPSTSAFDSEGNITVTAFVNEFYYETNPITKEYEKELWKSFVNQRPREMHILSKVKESADKSSTFVNASYTIRQESIQTIYNVEAPGLNSAWGMEHTDDEQEHNIYKYYGDQAPTGATDRGNTSNTNGRLNSLKEWELVDASGGHSILGQEGLEKNTWANFLNLTAANSTALLRDDNVGGNHHYQYLRWACMSRNRDNDGDGIIDQDEVRWYMAADVQLVGIFLGDYGIQLDAQLYQRPLVDRLSEDRETWRQHVIASTRYKKQTNSNTHARVVWAEEGINGSHISYTDKTYGATERFNIRCVRNLGYDPKSDGDITLAQDLNTEPDNYIVTTRMDSNGEYPEKNPNTGQKNSWKSDVYYIFDCSRINATSLRYYTDRELIEHDETHEASCLYKKFVVASRALSERSEYAIPDTKGGFKTRYINGLNNYLSQPGNIGHNPFCPEGYRLCNIREDAVLLCFVPSGEISSFMGSIFNHTRTHWSFGTQGMNKSGLGRKYWGWTLSSEKMIMAVENSQTTTSLRCVRDIKD